MVKKALIILAVLSSVTLTAGTSQSTPLRFSFWPKIWQWPEGVNVYGWSIGFPMSYDTGKVHVAGLDMALFRSSSSVKGVQMAGSNIGKNSVGIQIGTTNIYDNFQGVQKGIYNEYKDSAGFQLGVVNKATASKGFQLGIVNMMDNGIMPICPIVNFPKSWIQ